MARPWWQLMSVAEGASITFPAMIASRYAVTRKDGNGFSLSTVEGETEAAVVISVDETGKVKLNVGAKAAMDVRSNDRVVERETALKDGDRVKLAESEFVLRRQSCPVAEIKASLRQSIQCSICLRACQQPQLLRCGHSFCQSCLQQMIRLAMNRPVDRPIRFDAGFDAGLLALMDENEILQQTRSIKCGVCRQNFSCWEASRVCQPASLTKAIETMQELIDFEETLPKCGACQDARTMTDPRDYEFCERCKMILCPVCAVEGHRGHELRSKEAVVRQMHESGKRLFQMKMAMKRLRTMRQATLDALETNQTELTQQIDSMMPHMSAPIGQCKQLLSELERRAQPFATIDADRVASFDNAIKESRARIEKINSALDRFARALEETKNMLPPPPPPPVE